MIFGKLFLLGLVIHSSFGLNEALAAGPTISYNPSQQFQSSQSTSSIKHYSSYNEGSLYTQMTQKLKFAPYLQVNPNRSSFQTSFSIPLIQKILFMRVTVMVGS